MLFDKNQTIMLLVGFVVLLEWEKNQESPIPHLYIVV
jgi:hypothetical protein